MQKVTRHSNISIFIPHCGCPFACSFCNQKTISSAEKAPSPEEAEAIISGSFDYITDISKRAETEIAFFGGSFTAIDRSYMNALLDAAGKYVGKDGFKGIRISTRPDFIDGEILSLLKEKKVTAIELGAQSMDDGVLKLNNRGHTSADVSRSLELIQKYGFESGLQIMTGLYGSTPEKDMFTVKTAAELAPDTVRIYPTAVIDGTRLGELFKSGEYLPYPFKECVEVCTKAVVLFHKKGIKILRLGLHAEKSLEAKLLGGFYHPAFAEIVRSGLFRKSIESNLNADEGSADIIINPRDRSSAAGHKKSNIKYFSEMGITLNISEDCAVQRNKYIINGKTADIYETEV